MIALSSLVSRFEESSTLAIAARAKRMAAEGKSIINFGVGEPDFPTDKILIERAAESAKKGNTKYTPVGGVPSLRAAVAARISADYGVPYTAEEVICSAGGKQAIFHFLQATLEPGDEVLIYAPYWVSFPEMVKICGGTPVFLFSRDASELESKITSRTKAVILNSPSNPSGEVWSNAELDALAQVARRSRFWILSDDTYYKLTYRKDPWTSIAKLAPDLRNRICIIGSTSKSYAMTGWRLGWALGPKALIDAMIKIQSQVTSNPCSLSQVAGEMALTTEHERITSTLFSRFRARRDRMIQGLQSLGGLSWPEPEGAFYVFVNFAERLKSRSVTAWASELLDNYGVCTIPGEGFGARDYLRFSYALSEGEIDEGIKRLEKALKS